MPGRRYPWGNDDYPRRRHGHRLVRELQWTSPRTPTASIRGDLGKPEYRSTWWQHGDSLAQATDIVVPEGATVSGKDAALSHGAAAAGGSVAGNLTHSGVARPGVCASAYRAGVTNLYDLEPEPSDTE